MIRSDIKNSIKKLLLIMGVGFVIYIIAANWNDFVVSLKNTNYFILACAVLMAEVFALLYSALYVDLCNKYSINIKYIAGVKLYLIGQIAKYIPGKLWGVVYQASAIEGERALGKTALVNLEMMYIAAFQVTALAVFLLLSEHLFLQLIVALFGLSIFYILINKIHAGKILSLIGLSDKYSHDGRIDTNFISFSRISLIFLASTGAYYMTSYLLLEAIADLSIEQMMNIIALLSLSWVIGVLSIVFPAGIGVREYAFITISSYFGYIDAGLLVTIVILSRLIQIAQDLLGGVIILILNHWSSDITDETQR